MSLEIFARKCQIAPTKKPEKKHEVFILVPGATLASLTAIAK